MKINEAYIYFIDLVNRNATNNNINVDKPRFINLFNKLSVEYTSWILEKRNEDVIRHISPLLILEKPLKVKENKDSYSSFTLPTDYFDLANLHITASQGDCKGEKIYTFEVKSENLEELLSDVNNRPSFKFRETFYLTSNGAVAIYKDNFTFDQVSLSYYRYPKTVDMAGYIHSDGTSSADIDPEFDDKVVHKILTGMAKQFSATNGDQLAYTVNKDKLFSEI